MVVPSPALAACLAAEWDRQRAHLQPAQMPLTALACTVLDQACAVARPARVEAGTTPVSNSANGDCDGRWSHERTNGDDAAVPGSTATPAASVIASGQERFVEQALRYLPTDTVCYYADPVEERVLYRRQCEAWDPIHDWVQSTWGHRPATVQGLQDGILFSTRARVLHGGAPTSEVGTPASTSTVLGRGKGRAGLPHPAQLVRACERWARELDAWHLVALCSVAADTKSYFTAMMLLMRDHQNEEGGASVERDPLPSRPCLVSNAVLASRVEEEFQIGNWGLVEGGHDYDRLNASVQLHAAAVLLDCLSIDCDL
jgi:ATP synthase F1 complex assembly factor 2